MLEVRAAGASDETEEVINSVWDRLTGWCHASRSISLARSEPPSESEIARSGEESEQPARGAVRKRDGANGKTTAEAIEHLNSLWQRQAAGG